MEGGTNKERYRELCRSEPTIPIFSRDWWLDAVCGEDWDVALVEKGGEVVGSLPYHFRKRLGTMVIMMPTLTHTLGPWIKYPRSQKYHNRLSHENEVISALIDSLPPHGYFEQRFHPSVTNWLPLYWKGFRQTTRYTYIIPDLGDLDKVWQGVDKGLRRRITKASESVRTVETEDVRTFYDITSYVWEKQGLRIPYSLDFIKRIDEACRDQGRRRILAAVDENDEVHAIDYTVWDDDKVHGLMSGISPKHRKDDSFKLLCWEALKFASEAGKSFDFGGSMLSQIEELNRSFGAYQVPYFSVFKVDSLPIRAVEGGKRLLLPYMNKSTTPP